MGGGDRLGISVSWGTTWPRYQLVQTASRRHHPLRAQVRQAALLGSLPSYHSRPPPSARRHTQGARRRRLSRSPARGQRRARHPLHARLAGCLRMRAATHVPEPPGFQLPRERARVSRRSLPVYSNKPKAFRRSSVFTAGAALFHTSNTEIGKPAEEPSTKPERSGAQTPPPAPCHSPLLSLVTCASPSYCVRKCHLLLGSTYSSATRVFLGTTTTLSVSTTTYIRACRHHRCWSRIAPMSRATIPSAPGRRQAWPHQRLGRSTRLARAANSCALKEMILLSADAPFIL